MRVLGLETSCDETAAAIYDDEKGLLANLVYSQEYEHSDYGGIVPELAARDHICRLLPLVEKTLQQSATSPTSLDAVAYTAGPGLFGALVVGASLGRSLAFAWDLAALEINHLEGHLMACLLETNPPKYPFLVLLVSGAHTQLVVARAFGDYTTLGESRDDAVGEAFDKVARMLGLGYPGGRLLAELAEQGQRNRFDFPRPMLNKGLEFSFSGLKTAVALAVNRQQPLTKSTAADLAASFEQSVVETLLHKCTRALHQCQLKDLVVCGGVGANKHLRVTLNRELGKQGYQVHYPTPSLCTDNAAMIAYTGYLRLVSGGVTSLKIAPQVRWSLETLAPPQTVNV